MVHSLNAGTEQFNSLYLLCTFPSFAPMADALTVTWRWGWSEQFVFYYHVDPFKPMSGSFKDRVVWDGNPEPV